ncbi:unnamed protein product [Trichogramma brassicae]|uniref:Uncharacterized protein n=1 Tax=Trichogramma brassicae TaxID=86971 RepID=A0A6H5HWV5_9HYME|nr:unnamed protein product [Trichogramma brassicae]
MNHQKLFIDVDENHGIYLARYARRLNRIGQRSTVVTIETKHRNIEYAQPTETEEVKVETVVTIEQTPEGKEKKVTKKKVTKHKGKKQQIVETVTVEEEGKAPITIVHEASEAVINVDESTGIIPNIEYAQPTETEEVKVDTVVTIEQTPEGKEKKVTKKKVTKQKGKKQQVVETVTVEEEGKAPITTVHEAPEAVIEFDEASGISQASSTHSRLEQKRSKKKQSLLLNKHRKVKKESNEEKGLRNKRARNNKSLKL